MPIYELPTEPIFPDPREAEDGLIAIGGDLSPIRLLTAYSEGIFPWFNPEDPIMWWSPNPRLVIIPSEIKVSDSLRRVIKSNRFTVKVDTNFAGVIGNCRNIARKEADGTWITDAMQDAYIALHELGFAHSIEIYNKERVLVGGLYGISMGKAFFGESMFSIERDASKVALYHLTELLNRWDFHFIDAQVTTDHLIRMGAKEISRDQFLEMLSNALDFDTKQGKWTILN